MVDPKTDIKYLEISSASGFFFNYFFTIFVMGIPQT